jgi:hypothetical protein
MAITIQSDCPDEINIKFSEELLETPHLPLIKLTDHSDNECISPAEIFKKKKI